MMDEIWHICTRVMLWAYMRSTARRTTNPSRDFWRNTYVDFWRTRILKISAYSAAPEYAVKVSYDSFGTSCIRGDSLRTSNSPPTIYNQIVQYTRAGILSHANNFVHSRGWCLLIYTSRDMCARRIHPIEQIIMSMRAHVPACSGAYQFILNCRHINHTSIFAKHIKCFQAINYSLSRLWVLCIRACTAPVRPPCVFTLNDKHKSEKEQARGRGLRGSVRDSPY